MFSMSISHALNATIPFSGSKECYLITVEVESWTIEGVCALLDCLDCVCHTLCVLGGGLPQAKCTSLIFNLIRNPVGSQSALCASVRSWRMSSSEESHADAQWSMERGPTYKLFLFVTESRLDGIIRTFGYPGQMLLLFMTGSYLYLVQMTSC